jgi:Zinc knuckle
MTFNDWKHHAIQIDQNMQMFRDITASNYRSIPMPQFKKPSLPYNQPNSSRPAPRATTYRGQGQPMVVDRKCYNCGKPGHFAKECRSRRQIRETIKEEIQEVRNTFKCFNCDKEGHMARNCPKPKKGYQRQSDLGTQNEELKETLAKMKDTMDILSR